MPSLHDTALFHSQFDRSALYRRNDPDFAHWAAGCGPIVHDPLTQVRVYELADLLVQRGAVAERRDVWQVLAAADRLACAAMWLVVHMTYARNVRLDGTDLAPDDFKPTPEGHTGGALNMAPAYVGYLAANAICGLTRAWMMGQGHCVAAIDSTNLLVGNMTAAHATRYGLSDEGLTRFVRDFYAYRVRPDGRPESPLGSHVNAHTAGGLIEGGYLGFAELNYVHMPLPGERLVVFLSDGAFEEQRGSDWAPRWWRAEDTGLVAPIMIANGRRIDQRTTVSLSGGVTWLRDHLRLNGFDPIDIDGRDPAAFAWAIVEMEERLAGHANAIRAGHRAYPVPLPYAIAEAPKGFGFPGAGTNAAHNLPLVENPHKDSDARSRFHEGARRLWVSPPELEGAIGRLTAHREQRRVRERDHALMRREVAAAIMPPITWRDPAAGGKAAPMEGIDEAFVAIVGANPGLRPRVGNPDELRSNRMNASLDLLKHRVTSPEAYAAEAIEGAVITALNEEAVACAALSNKGGLSIAVTYEAFGAKMLGAIRQELIFARHQREGGIEPQWLGVPMVMTSHTWENGKNEQSHQDPTLCEALMGEMSDGSRVVFPADWNTAAATLRAVYASRGQVWTVVAAKVSLPDRFTGAQAERLVADGALALRGDPATARVQFVAVGGYQLGEALRAADRLGERGVAASVVCLFEPGRFREPRDAREAAAQAPAAAREALFPSSAGARVIITHTRPEPLLGAIRPLDTGRATTRCLGYVNQGGTYDTPGLLFGNRCTWAHAVAAAAACLGEPAAALLSDAERAAIGGTGDPEVVR